MKHLYINQKIIDNKDNVICDVCSDEFKEGDERSGGFLFGAHAYCPKCATERLEGIKDYGEEGFIRAWCPGGMSFRRWVLDVLRNGNNLIVITTMERK